MFESLALTISGSKMMVPNRWRGLASRKSDSQHTVGFLKDRSILQRELWGCIRKCLWNQKASG